MAYHLLAVDLDRTLLDPHHGLNHSARLAVKLAQEHGIQVCIATGRAYQSAERLDLALQTRGPLIANNGAVVKHPGGPFLRERRLPRTLVQQLIEQAEKESVLTYTYAREGVFVSTSSPSTARYAQALDIPISTSHVFREFKDPSIYGVAFRVDPEQGACLEKRWATRVRGQAQVLRSVPSLIEVLPRDASKGLALRFVMNRLGLAPEEVVAIGDGPSDRDMLELAGLGVFVANAHPSLHPFADLVTSGCYSEGVLQVVKQHLLGK